MAKTLAPLTVTHLPAQGFAPRPSASAFTVREPSSPAVRREAPKAASSTASANRFIVASSQVHDLPASRTCPATLRRFGCRGPQPVGRLSAYEDQAACAGRLHHRRSDRSRAAMGGFFRNLQIYPLTITGRRARIERNL